MTGADFESFFANAPRMNPAREAITGTVCGVRVEEVEEPLMRELRYLDKLIEEVARGEEDGDDFAGAVKPVRRPPYAHPFHPAKSNVRALQESFLLSAAGTAADKTAGAGAVDDFDLGSSVRPPAASPNRGGE